MTDRIWMLLFVVGFVLFTLAIGSIIQRSFQLGYEMAVRGVQTQAEDLARRQGALDSLLVASRTMCWPKSGGYGYECIVQGPSVEGRLRKVDE